MKLLISSPALASKTTASAISETTSALRKRRLPLAGLDSDLPPSLSESFRLSRETCNAGASPKMIPVNTEMPSVHNSTVTFKPTLCRLMRSFGLIIISALIPNHAKASPRTLPSSASNRLSVSSCLTIRMRRAPSAARTAISFSRAAASDNSRLATFAHAISNTKPTAPSINHNGRFTFPKNCSRNGNTSALQFLLNCGASSDSRAWIVRNSVAAWSTITPSLRRATVDRKRPRSLAPGPVGIGSMVHSSAGRPVPERCWM